MGDVGHALVLGELEHDPPVREPDPPRRLERRPDAGRRLVDGVRQEVDRQPHVAGRKQPAGQLDRLGAAGLVEAVAVVVVDLAEDVPGALALGAAHQRLVAPDLVPLDVDDGVKGHREGEGKRFTAPALPTSAPLGHRTAPDPPVDTLPGLSSCKVKPVAPGRDSTICFVRSRGEVTRRGLRHVVARIPRPARQRRSRQRAGWHRIGHFRSPGRLSRSSSDVVWAMSS
ncbi:hypothetical protein Maq22A_c27750 [Methylobacterium aquaticum]|uniref:Uncharacterized protein n=1 Tax=Methylobacterium aquaticum TaxID=270351 RepID=A0A1Y0ZFX8_9HYPH|nr:hypothetical protein Maq22A_c27750 [Methylobacterium aquaticum]